MVMRLLDLFSGIGGFSYAAEKLVGGYETVAFCEQDKFCQQVLRKHWKDVPIYDDVRTIDATGLGRIDIVAGGFPCQAVSQAGLQKATEDDRWLWDEMFRIIQDCKPKWVIGENVQGLININEGVLFEQVQTDLENEGYSVQSVVIPACAKNAPHRRDRVWIIAHSNISSQPNESEYGAKRQGELGPVCNSEHNGSLATKIRGSNEEVAGRTQKGQETTRQFEGTSRSENHDDVPNTKRMGWTERTKIRETSERERWADKFSNSSSTVTKTEDVSDTINKRSQGGLRRGKDKKWEDQLRHTRCSSSVFEQQRKETTTTERRLGYMADGLSEALSGHFSEEPKDIPRVTQNQKDRTKKLKALGNSIVPQVAAELFYAIKVAEHDES
tara:strand:- start:189 stop:1343 length:1155 start_codon:yes stop_codon:yes gene_type:complete